MKLSRKQDSVTEKILRRLKEPASIFYSHITKTSFPEYSSPQFVINTRLSAALHDIKKYNIHNNIGALMPKVNPYAANVYSAFIKSNPNNLGNWSITPYESGTKRLEYELIHKLIDLYHAKDEYVEGYATGGGTEGNLYSVWIAKSYLLKHVQLKNICLLRTELTHYSIDKACNLYSLNQNIIPLHSSSWTMDAKALIKMMATKIRHGICGFIISLTYGYTESGSSDNINDILLAITEVKKKYAHIRVSIIIDAAFNGLILPFITDDFRPFIHPDIHAIALDFTKFTAIPYSAGVVLYRKKLRLLVEKTVPVFSMKDNTIAGSRPGASVAAMWAVIHQYGRQKFKKIITEQMQIKMYFMERMKQIFPNSEIISDPLGLTCGVILDMNKNITIPEQIEKKYWLYAKQKRLTFSNGKKRTFTLYKFFFLQHVNKKTINYFLEELQKSFE